MSAKLIDKDHGWAKFFENVAELRLDPQVKVGVLADSEKGGMHVPGGSLTVAEIAAVHEFGTEDGHIPERSFVRRTFDEQREALVEETRHLLAEVLFGDLAVRDALGQIGAKLAAEIKKRVTTGEQIPPPDAPATILRKLRKGRTKSLFRGAMTLGKGLAQAGAAAAVRTLVDTGRMVNAITWAVMLNGKAEE